MSTSTATGGLPPEIWIMVARHLRRPLPLPCLPNAPHPRIEGKDLHQKYLLPIIRVNSTLNRIVTPVLYTTIVTDSLPDLLYGFFANQRYPIERSRLSPDKRKCLSMIKNLYIEIPNFTTANTFNRNARALIDVLKDLLVHTIETEWKIFKVDKLAIAAFSTGVHYHPSKWERWLFSRRSMEGHEDFRAIQYMIPRIFSAEEIFQASPKAFFDLTVDMPEQGVPFCAICPFCGKVGESE